jgi:Cu/Ag efflux pump CusA
VIKALLKFVLTRRAIIMTGTLVFLAGGLAAFSNLNIEAYPNPAPVILEITAQAPGLSAEEMEKYYTIPIEVGLYPTPGIDTIRSTSFYGLSFVRVTFKYGVDYYFAYTQSALSLQQNVSLPASQIPQIQQSSLVGEIFRYQMVGPPHFGLTNLRTIQDWVVTRRLMAIPGVVQINSWGGTTKQFNVDADLQKLEAYNITVPQLVTAIGNANSNVGGREITIGQQSVNIRGIGLIDDGGADVITNGYKVNDIENIVLTQSNGIPVLVKDIAKVSVGHVPRLGIAGHDHDDELPRQSLSWAGPNIRTRSCPVFRPKSQRSIQMAPCLRESKSFPITTAVRSYRSPPTRSCTTSCSAASSFSSSSSFSWVICAAPSSSARIFHSRCFSPLSFSCFGARTPTSCRWRSRLQDHRRFGGDLGREYL